MGYHLVLIGLLLSATCLVWGNQGPTHGRACSTQCDCHQNSGGFDESGMNICYECSVEHGNTCQPIAMCASGYTCSMDLDGDLNKKYHPQHSVGTLDDIDWYRRLPITSSAYFNQRNLTLSFHHTVGVSYKIDQMECIKQYQMPQLTTSLKDAQVVSIGGDGGSKFQGSCLVNEDCTKSFSSNILPLSSQTVLERTVISASGICLPSGICRYLPYGIIHEPGNVLLQTMRPFDHKTCKHESRECSHSLDCINLARRNNSIQAITSVCQLETGKCVDQLRGEINSMVDRSINTEQQVVNLITSIKQMIEHRGVNTTEGMECETDEMCTKHALEHDVNAHKSCYACVTTSIRSSRGYNQDKKRDDYNWDIKKVCKRTENDCASGRCHNGQCLAKTCRTHSDCLEVAGDSRDCYYCDAPINKLPKTSARIITPLALGLCRVRQPCFGNGFCDKIMGEFARCTNMIKTCIVGGGENNIRTGGGVGAIGNTDICVALGSSNIGYTRTTSLIYDPRTFTVISGGKVLQNGKEVDLSKSDMALDSILKQGGSLLTQHQARQNIYRSEIDEYNLLNDGNEKEMPKNNPLSSHQQKQNSTTNQTPIITIDMKDLPNRPKKPKVIQHTVSTSQVDAPFAVITEDVVVVINETPQQQTKPTITITTSPPISLPKKSSINKATTTKQNSSNSTVVQAKGPVIALLVIMCIILAAMIFYGIWTGLVKSYIIWLRDKIYKSNSKNNRGGGLYKKKISSSPDNQISGSSSSSNGNTVKNRRTQYNHRGSLLND